MRACSPVLFVAVMVLLPGTAVANARLKALPEPMYDTLVLDEHNLRNPGPSCDAGDPVACNAFALAALNASPPRVGEARTALRRACGPDRDASCENLAHLLRQSNDAVDAEEALALSTAACMRGWGMSCLRAGMQRYQGAGVEADPLAADHFFARGCALDHALSCFAWGSLSGPDWPRERVDALFRSCELGFAHACTNPTWITTVEDPTAFDADRARRIARLSAAACRFGNSDQCVARAWQSAGDIAILTDAIAAVEFAHWACRVGRFGACDLFDTIVEREGTTLLDRAGERWLSECLRDSTPRCSLLLDLRTRLRVSTATGRDTRVLDAMLQRACLLGDTGACGVFGSRYWTGTVEDASDGDHVPRASYDRLCERGNLWTGAAYLRTFRPLGRVPHRDRAEVRRMAEAMCQAGVGPACDVAAVMRLYAAPASDDSQHWEDASNACYQGLDEACVLAGKRLFGPNAPESSARDDRHHIMRYGCHQGSRTACFHVARAPDRPASKGALAMIERRLCGLGYPAFCKVSSPPPPTAAPTATAPARPGAAPADPSIIAALRPDVCRDQRSLECVLFDTCMGKDPSVCAAVQYPLEPDGITRRIVPGLFEAVQTHACASEVPSACRRRGVLGLDPRAATHRATDVWLDLAAACRLGDPLGCRLLVDVPPWISEPEPVRRASAALVSDCRAGKPDACANAAVWHLKGLAPLPEGENPLSWLRDACSPEHPWICLMWVAWADRDPGPAVDWLAATTTLADRCAEGFRPACTAHALRVGSRIGPGLGAEPAREILRVACGGGDSHACHLHRSHRGANAHQSAASFRLIDILSSECRRGVLGACADVIALFVDEKGDLLAETIVEHVALWAHASGSGSAAVLLGRRTLDRPATPLDRPHEVAADWFARGCALGDIDGCDALVTLANNGHIPASPDAIRIEAAKRACRADRPAGCRFLAALPTGSW